MEHEFDASILETKWETEMMQIKKKKKLQKSKYTLSNGQIYIN